MWGMFGPITIGISLELGSEQQLSVISHLQSMSTLQNIAERTRITIVYNCGLVVRVISVTSLSNSVRLKTACGALLYGPLPRQRFLW